MIVDPADVPSMHFGRVLQVRKTPVGLVFAEFALGFGINHQRLVNLEGVDPSRIPPKYQGKAHHGLVLLLGGKNIVAYTKGTTGHVQARVFVNERFTPSDANRELASQPYMFDVQMLDVALCFRFLADNRYDVNVLKQAIK